MAYGSGVKTNERPGTRAQVRYVRVSAYKAREVLDLIRDMHVADADQVLAFTERDVAKVVRKGLASAVANAQNNDSQDGDTLKVVACYADEGPTLKRWRPRARGRATRIRKRTCHITIIVARMPEDELRRWQEQNQKGLTTEGGRGGRRRTPAADRRARVARSRKAEGTEETTEEATDEVVTAEEATVDEAIGSTEEPATDEVEADEATDTEADEATEIEDEGDTSSDDEDEDK